MSRCSICAFSTDSHPEGSFAPAAPGRGDEEYHEDTRRTRGRRTVRRRIRTFDAPAHGDSAHILMREGFIERTRPITEAVDAAEERAKLDAVRRLGSLSVSGVNEKKGGGRVMLGSTATLAAGRPAAVQLTWQRPQAA